MTVEKPDIITKVPGGRIRSCPQPHHLRWWCLKFCKHNVTVTAAETLGLELKPLSSTLRAVRNWVQYVDVLWEIAVNLIIWIWFFRSS